MRKRCFFILAMCFTLFFASATVLAASKSGTYSFAKSDVDVSASVGFVYGPLAIQDRYWGNASISGRDSDVATVKVKGWTEKKSDIINTTLSYKKKSISKQNVHCGYGQSWGKISVTFESKTYTLKAVDSN